MSFNEFQWSCDEEGSSGFENIFYDDGENPDPHENFPDFSFPELEPWSPTDSDPNQVISDDQLLQLPLKVEPIFQDPVIEQISQDPVIEPISQDPVIEPTRVTYGEGKDAIKIKKNKFYVSNTTKNPEFKEFKRAFVNVHGKPFKDTIINFLQKENIHLTRDEKRNSGLIFNKIRFTPAIKEIVYGSLNKKE